MSLPGTRSLPTSLSLSLVFFSTVCSLSLTHSLSLMPQMDPEILVCDGSGRGPDGQVACENLIGSGEGPPDQPPEEAAQQEDPDLPAESVQVRIGDEIDWTDLNAVYDRDDSTKGNTNPKSQHSNPNKPRSNSQRFSGNLKPKAPIIGLPAKLQHSGYLGRSGRRPPTGRIFPKKGVSARSGGKAAAVESEPGSPKVSCIGKVLSERERDRCRKARRRLVEEREEGQGGGCWAFFPVVFRCCGGAERRAAVVECVEDSPAPPSGKLKPPRDSAAERESVTAEPPGLGAMKRFESGRRSASWGSDADAEEHVAWSEPLDRDGLRARRSVGSLEDRVWESEGSTSV